jgi:uracil-DNA glycosylase
LLYRDRRDGWIAWIAGSTVRRIDRSPARQNTGSTERRIARTTDQHDEGPTDEASIAMTTVPEPLDRLLAEVRKCAVCAEVLPLGPRPVLRCGPRARILVVGQAPGAKVHASGIPWDDPSGDRLRAWLGVDRATFYDVDHFDIVPIGLCYPGRGASGDLPPRPECAPLWANRLRRALPRVELTLLIGGYAQAHHLGDRRHPTLTETVRAWRTFTPECFVSPHPSPRNNIWLRRNPWFESEVVPAMRRAVHRLLPGRGS